MSNSTLKNDVSRYFDDRLRDAGPIEFDAVTVQPSSNWHIPAFVAIAALIAITAMLWPARTSTLSDQLLATTRWQSDTDVFLHYEGRHFLYKLPELEIK